MKFSIRDLFLVTVIVAVCVAWWVDHRRAAEIDRWRLKEVERTEREKSAMAEALDKSWPGWRDDDGSYYFSTGVHGTKTELTPRKPLPTSQSPAPTPKS